MTDARTVTIQNVGPIAGPIAIPIPDGGGIVVMRGANGAGKTTALEALDGILRGRTPAASARLGSTGGAVEGLGRTVSVGLKRSRVAGELVVDTIDSAADVSRLVDPGLKDPERADAQRIKVACALAQIEPDPAAFTRLLEGIGKASEFLTDESLGCGDVVEMAARTRRELHAAALRDERAAEQARAKAAGMTVHVEEAAIAAPPKAEAMARLEEVLGRKARVEAEIAAAAKRTREVEDARRQLDSAVSAYQGPTAAVAQEREAAAAQALGAARAAAAEAKRLLDEAAAAYDAAEREARAAIEHEKVVAAAREIIAAGAPAATDEALARLDAVEQDLVAARAQVAAAEAAETHRRALDAAEAIRLEADELDARSQQLREAARATDDVLAGLLVDVAPAGLMIRGGRLIVAQGDTEKFFADLSEGERWRLALDLAIEALGDGDAVLSISQSAWEGLDGNARRAINEHARSRGTVIVTAEADHEVVGELRAEVFSGGQP